ncbi:hypothetical protein SUNI508_07711 [Seiridium unicorne]|uniref:Protein S-acyltransferase n=1 Tax=Seiridium unicorne TaxID=138068 RepID=A0ABR2UWP1_9PEZI
MDHFCTWLYVTVYSRTMKTYLYTLLFLPLDAVATLIVLAVNLSSPGGVVDWPTSVAVFSSLAALVVGVSLFGPQQWKHLAMRNEVVLEWRRPRRPILLGFKDARDTRRPLIRFRLFEGNPWDRGTKKNLHHVLGSSWWMWLFFWWQPARVYKYGRYQPDIDLPYSDAVWDVQREVLGLSVEFDVGIEMADLAESASRQGGSRATRLRRSAQSSSASHAEEPSTAARRRGARSN